MAKNTKTAAPRTQTGSTPIRTGISTAAERGRVTVDIVSHEWLEMNRYGEMAPKLYDYTLVSRT